MKKLILHPTDTCQWHALVNEAQASSCLVLEEDTESYLVFLLMRFAQSTRLLESVIALDFLESMQLPIKQQVELLKGVGDKSLLFCGLFPGMAKRRNVSLDYFSDMGRAAYLSVGDLQLVTGQQESLSSDLYYQLSRQFSSLQQVLQAMRREYLHFFENTNDIDMPLH
jgi:hypothetical protein